MSDAQVTSIVIAGVGGQGIVTASDILSGALHRHGYDVKKSEIHGMSQRGGSVCSDVRFGQRVHSPMVPVGQAHYLVVMEPTQVGTNRHMLHADGVCITPDDVRYLLEPPDGSAPAPHVEKLLNVALLGVLSTYLEVSTDCWLDALRTELPPHVHELNEHLFHRARAIETMTRLFTASTSL